MKNKRILLIPLFLLVILLAACGGGETETPEATEAPTSVPVPTEEVEEITDVTPIAVEEVQNITWLWSALIETQPAGQSVVPDPENYTLALFSDGSFAAKADCNNVLGSYQVEGINITLTLGPTTMAECGEGSLYNQYMSLLGSAINFGARNGALVLGLQDAGSEMQFANGGPAEQQPTPEPDTCDAGIDPTTVKINTQGLYTSYLAECILATPYDATQPPGPTGLPDNIQVYFDLTDPEGWQMDDPIVYIIPVVEYVAMWEANGNDSVTNSIEALRELLANKPEPVPTTGLPVLPYEMISGVSDIQVQGKYLKTEMGEGVRFVTRFSQGPNPVTSDNPPLYYTFQGFSSDGEYLITFFNPVTTESLPTAGEVTDEERQQVNEDSQAYLDQKTTELNNLSASDWQPNLDTLDAMIISLRYGEEEPAPPANPLTNINWLWTTLTETNPAGQSIIPNPENYNLVFHNDGSLFYKADCNLGNGTYTTSSSEMSITLGPATLVDCGEGSLSNQYMTLLGSVAAYAFEGGNLSLGLKNDAGSMGFVNGGPVDPATPPGTGVPTATTVEPLNVRSGPGTAYYSYGIVPAGTTFEVTGISEDGQWWVVKVPTSVAANGQGWINGNYVETSNVENVPVVPNPPIVTPTPTGAPSQTTTPAPGATETPTTSPGPTATQPAPANPLPGTSWTVSSMNGQAPLAGTSLTLAFADTAVSGNGGCNQFSGSYSVNGNSISIGSLSTTGALCGADIDQQEQQYLALLGSADSYQLDSGQLILFSAGSEVLRFN